MKWMAIILALLGLALGRHLPYIIGGTPVSNATKYPWHGSLMYYGNYHCGCALLNARWAVTAGHCVGAPESPYHATFGDVDWRKSDPAAIWQIIRHEDFNKGPGSYPNDIALLMFIPLVDNVKSISIASGDQADNSDCLITGWGWLSGTGKTSYILQEAKVVVYNQSQCLKEWGSEINDGHVCVGGYGAGSCIGDSGSPLVCNCKVDGSYQLVGVTSWGGYDCDLNYPSVYTRLEYFRSWIHQKAGV